MPTTTLTILYHDPPGLLTEQLERTLPTLNEIFPTITVQASLKANPKSLQSLRASGALIHQTEPPGPGAMIGWARREALRSALKTDCSHILYCDGDSALHWAEHFPEELEQTRDRLRSHDYTAIGRTERAIQTLPRPQRDTEAIVNHVFYLATGRAWHVTAGACGLSRQAGEHVLETCQDDSFTTDVSWPLTLLKTGRFQMDCLAVDGMAYETGERHRAEIDAAGGYQAWLSVYENDPQHWRRRMSMALMEIEAIEKYHA